MIVDFCILIFNLLIVILKEEDLFRWLFGWVFCLYIMLIIEMFFGVVIFFIGLIGFERYVNIVWKIVCVWRRLLYKKRCFILIGVWVFVFVVGFIFMYVFIEYDLCYKMCYFFWLMIVFIIYIMIFMVFWYVFFLVVVVFSYIKIV